MVDISKEEFEKEIEKLIAGEITKGKLAKKLETEPRTLDIKIQEMSATSPDIYERYLKALPYKQKGYDHIDFEALVIYMLKQSITINEAADKFGISRRTINRRINDMENRDLADLYKRVADNRKHVRQDDVLTKRKIEELESRPVVLNGVNDRRKNELLKIEAEFNELCKTMTKEEAAKKMGYCDRSRVNKMLNELYRIEIEEEHKDISFRERIKVTPDQNNIPEKMAEELDTKVQKENADNNIDR